MTTYTYKLQGDGRDSWVANDNGNIYMVYEEPTRLQDISEALKREQLGKDVIKELFISLRNQNLTQAQDGDLINRVSVVLMALGFGFILGARAIANALVLGGQLTQPRKDFILSKIDEAITKL